MARFTIQLTPQLLLHRRTRPHPLPALHVHLDNILLGPLFSIVFPLCGKWLGAYQCREPRSLVSHPFLQSAFVSINSSWTACSLHGYFGCLVLLPSQTHWMEDWTAGTFLCPLYLHYTKLTRLTSRTGVVYCDQLNALEAFAWIELCVPHSGLYLLPQLILTKPNLLASWLRSRWSSSSFVA